MPGKARYRLTVEGQNPENKEEWIKGVTIELDTYYLLASDLAEWVTQEVDSNAIVTIHAEIP